MKTNALEKKTLALAVSATLTRNAVEVFTRELASTAPILAVTGYAGAGSLRFLLASHAGHARVSGRMLVVGMAWDGLTQEQLSLHSGLMKIGWDIRVPPSGERIHSKVTCLPASGVSIVGSSNLDSLAGVSTLTETDDVYTYADLSHPDFVLRKKDLDDVISRTVPLSSVLDRIPVVLKEASAGGVVPPSGNSRDCLIDVFLSRNPSHPHPSFCLPIGRPSENGSVAEKAGINASRGAPRNAKKKVNGVVVVIAGTPRSFMECALTVSARIKREPWWGASGFPIDPKMSKKGDKFLVTFADSSGALVTIACSVSGQGAKNLQSSKLADLGELLKIPLVELGLIKYGEIITQDVLEKYGNDRVTFLRTEDRLGPDGKWMRHFLASFVPKVAS